jgi:transposase
MDSAAEKRIQTMLPYLDEKQRRLFLAAEAESMGRGGVKAIHELTGMSKTTIIRGKKELEDKGNNDERVRKKGGGRKAIEIKHVSVNSEIEQIVSNNTLGHPERVILWTTKSLRNIQKSLSERGIDVSHVKIGDLLKEMDYSLQLNQKMLQTGTSHPDRDAQFEYINRKSYQFIEEGQPVISVDTKKKELVGNFKNNGATYRKKNDPIKVLDHDFPLKELGKVAPYGIYDISKNEGFVNLGISHDTAEFAVESILRWWLTLGTNTYPDAVKLYINSDNGGSNGSRNRLWKKQLQQMADITGLEIHVSHFPPGTSKWNKIEHRMFCYISKNWKGQPLISIETIVNLISSTTTSKGLKIVCKRDDNKYELGQKVTDEEFADINLTRDEFLGDWNYIITTR